MSPEFADVALPINDTVTAVSCLIEDVVVRDKLYAVKETAPHALDGVHVNPLVVSEPPASSLEVCITGRPVESLIYITLIHTVPLSRPIDPAHDVVAKKWKVTVLVAAVAVYSFDIGISNGFTFEAYLGYSLHEDGVFAESASVALRVG